MLRRQDYRQTAFDRVRHRRRVQKHLAGFMGAASGIHSLQCQRRLAASPRQPPITLPASFGHKNPVFGFCSFVYACHTGENKSENKKFKKNQIKSRKSLRFNGRNLVHINEGSIPLTRSIHNQQLMSVCSKSAVELSIYQISFATNRKV
jgi:hypothetical protein